MRLFDAGSAVGKLYDYFFSLMLGAHLKQSAARVLEGVQSILDNLGESLEQLVAVAPYVRQLRLDGGFDADSLIVALQSSHLHAALQKRAQIHQRLLSGTLLGEAEQVRYKLAGALGLVHDLAHECVLLGGQAL